MLWQDEASGPSRYVALSLRPGEVVFGNTQEDVKQIIYQLRSSGELLVRLVKVVKGKTRHIDYVFQRQLPSGAAGSVPSGIPARCRVLSGGRPQATDWCAPIPW